MSMEHMGRVTCPDCKTEGDFIVWNTLNAQINPEAKTQLLSGELFRYICPKCGRETNIEYPMLYHEMEKQIMIYLVTNDDETAMAVTAFETMVNGGLPGFPTGNDGFTLRLVRNQNQLREKAYIFDQDLDDRCIELVKLCIRTTLMMTQPDVKVEEILLAIRNGAPENFAVRTADGRWGTVPFQKELYDSFLNDMSEPTEEDKKKYFIDQDWAVEHMD